MPMKRSFFGWRERAVVVGSVLMTACFAVGEIVRLGLHAYQLVRYSNVSTIVVSKLSDLDPVFDVSSSSLRVRNPEFLKVCLSGDYSFTLKDARQWFVGEDAAGFARALEAAGGPADVYNGEEASSIVLLSRRSAVILKFDPQIEFYALNYGCASVKDGDILLKRYASNSITRFYLPNATLRESQGTGKPQATLCEQKLARLVGSIDELLAEKTRLYEPFWAAIRKYLPAQGCTVDEVMSVSRTSRFARAPFEQNNHYTMSFRNSDTEIGFWLQRDTGNIERPYVASTRGELPSL